jgi:hypothetical protein
VEDDDSEESSDEDVPDLDDGGAWGPERGRMGGPERALGGAAAARAVAQRRRTRSLDQR